MKAMQAVEWHGTRSVKLKYRELPTLSKPTDALLRVTSTSICGSDLHLYNNEFSGMEKKDILGHEFMGVIEQVGTEVKSIKPGDRVVCSFLICCGSCHYCVNGLTSCCDNTNDSAEMEASYGHRISGMFGYSHLTGGYRGGQAEMVRIPHADVVCLKLPSFEHFPDEKLLFLSDVMCTGFHATECGGVSPGQTVAVWGLGPIGQMALAFSKFRGANRIIGIDSDPFRLEFARTKLGAEVIDCSKVDVVETLRELAPSGVDVAIDAAGFRSPMTTAHKLQRALGLETDSPEILHQAILSLRKAGNLSIVGDYFQNTNNFPIGALMEKSISVRGGQCPVQRYWSFLLNLIEKGDFDPSFIITHIWPFERVVEAYDLFDRHRDNCLKVVLKTAFGAQLANKHGSAIDTPNLVQSAVSSAALQNTPFYINPAVVADRPWPQYPLSGLSDDKLPSGEFTGLTSSVRMPLMSNICRCSAAQALSCPPVASAQNTSPARASAPMKKQQPLHHPKGFLETGISNANAAGTGLGSESADRVNNTSAAEGDEPSNLKEDMVSLF